MKHYKRYLPIVAIVLIGLGVNLDEFGIDLQRIASQSGIEAPIDSGVDSGADSGADSPADTAASTAYRPPDYTQWSTTQPNINLWHLFEGEINRRGEPVGFHSRPGGDDPANARVLRLRDGPNRHGVYTAQVEVRGIDGARTKFSSFFPDDLSRQAVIDAVLAAYRASDNPRAQPWEGPSGLGFRIQGYTSSRGGINTAFPLFVNDR